jgi:hypothetical protein
MRDGRLSQRRAKHSCLAWCDAVSTTFRTIKASSSNRIHKFYIDLFSNFRSQQNQRHIRQAQ